MDLSHVMTPCCSPWVSPSQLEFWGLSLMLNKHQADGQAEETGKGLLSELSFPRREWRRTVGGKVKSGYSVSRWATAVES